MEVADIIALGGLILAIVVLLKDLFNDSKKDTKTDTKVLADLSAEMEYITKQLESICDQLNEFDKDKNSTNIAVAIYDEKFKNIYKDIKNLLYRVRRIENHLGLGEIEDEE